MAEGYRSLNPEFIINPGRDWYRYMAAFACNGCGKCCRSFGAFIRIERQLTGSDYYCRYGLTQELFPVHVLPAYADEIAGEFEDNEGVAGAEKKACPFLRPDKECAGFACAIYPTRPPVCREFRCYRMLIYDGASGEERGTVVGSYDLQTPDEALALLWKEKIADLTNPKSQKNTDRSSNGPGTGDSGDREWTRTVIAILAAHGFRGEPVQ